ncbi:MAG: deoxynucleoside kinase [Mycoplasmatales bacterium]|nr:deoxynucleoside kinase [Mycoplasmatales bacterium]
MRKEANLIIIGGTIAAGKSTLVDGISKRRGYYPVPELREGDEVQEIILKKLYEGKRIHNATIQFYFIANRYKQYKDESGGMITSILDRGIWEDWFFALLLMANEKRSYEHFKFLWKTTIKKILDIYGYPKAYIYTKVGWENFKERVFLRNRNAEVANFSQNEEYFRKLLNEYNNNFESLLKEWDIEPIIIDTNNINKDQVLEIALKELEKKGL